MFKVFRYALVPTSEPHVNATDGPDGWASEMQDDGGDFESLIRQGYHSTIEMPVGGEVVEVAMSSRGPTIYAVVDPDADLKQRSFFVCGNGVELPSLDSDELKLAQMHVGTYKIPGGITAHVFETAQVPVPA